MLVYVVLFEAAYVRLVAVDGSLDFGACNMVAVAGDV